MRPNGPFNRPVRDDLPVRDATRVEQVRTRRSCLRAFKEALVLERAVHLIADSVCR